MRACIFLLQDSQRKNTQEMKSIALDRIRSRGASVELLVAMPHLAASVLLIGHLSKPSVLVSASGIFMGRLGGALAQYGVGCAE